MSYDLVDDPRPSSRLAHLVCRPTAPLLATMVAGAWLAWPWFIVNSFALGSPTRRKELLLCALGFAGTTVLAIVLVMLNRAGIIVGLTRIRLALLAVSTWKLWIGYQVSELQGRTFHVYEYYGGVVQQPRRALIVGAILRATVIGMFSSDLWAIIVSGGA